MNSLRCTACANSIHLFKRCVIAGRLQDVDVSVYVPSQFVCAGDVSDRGVDVYMLDTAVKQKLVDKFCYFNIWVTCW